MKKGKSILSNILGNDTVLWFIILFLLIFWCCGYFGTGEDRTEGYWTGLGIAANELASDVVLIGPVHIIVPIVDSPWGMRMINQACFHDKTGPVNFTS